ncbi:family 43 glycosylhydrolase [Parabacteroides sp. FAFU027]|uniref:family 43 glycosylhydrolase n=1 Tax=Parabacteroides sp. FAFU027 TaxID=2922715 RepID=UPI001FAF3FFE|nr:discoidin domain-containing protein [Parabacteroides sp. FAFU027]
MKASICLIALMPYLSFAQTEPSTKTVKGQISEYHIPVVQTYRLNGRITDEAGRALSDVRIMIKGDVVSANSDSQGNYSITIAPHNKALIFYYPGKSWLELALQDNQTQMDVTLKSEQPLKPIERTPAIATSWFDPNNDHPHTYCNPVNISYLFEYYFPTRKQISCRSTADPLIVPYKGEYYLFCTNQSGYYVSKNLTQWQYICSAFQRKPFDDDQCAPSVTVMGDTMVMLGSTYNELPVWYTTDPRTGRWKHLTETALLPHWDPYMFRDDDKRLYLYYGSSNEFPIKGVEYDPATFRPKSIIRDLYILHPEQHGWERFGMNNDDSVSLKPFTEGAFMTKYNNKYYLQYGAPGTEFKVYADGVYVSDNPLGPFVYQKHNPFSYKPGGFVLGAGHGGTFRDYHGNYWHIATCMLSLRETFERRIGLYPSGFDRDGIMYANTAFGDYPTVTPVSGEDHQRGNFAGWMLLSLHKKVWASSSDSIYTPEKAADENMRTYWAAKSNQSGEWFAMDLGTEKQVYAIQVNYYEHKANQFGKAMDTYHQYKIFGSADGNQWSLIVDKSNNDLDVPHDYVELLRPATVRYLKIENIHTASGNFALMDLRVFGKAQGKIPAQVKQFKVKRQSRDGRNALISWKAQQDAYGYNIYYGTASDKLYNCITVYDSNSYNMRGLDKGTSYFFSVEALGETGISARSAVVETKD